MNRRETQCLQVLDYLKQHGSMTQADADRLGIKRLASRICDLRKDHYPIEARLVKVTNRDGSTSHVARYSMRKEQKEEVSHPQRVYSYGQIARIIGYINEQEKLLGSPLTMRLNIETYFSIKGKCRYLFRYAGENEFFIEKVRLIIDETMPRGQARVGKETE